MIVLGSAVIYLVAVADAESSVQFDDDEFADGF